MQVLTSCLWTLSVSFSLASLNKKTKEAVWEILEQTFMDSDGVDGGICFFFFSFVQHIGWMKKKKQCIVNFTLISIVY